MLRAMLVVVVLLLLLGIAFTAIATDVPPPLVSEGLANDGGIHLGIGRQAILKTVRQYKRLTVAQPDVAEINPIGPTQILVTGKSAGVTDFSLWDDQDASQTIQITVARATAPEPEPATVWADGVAPVANAIPGFIQLNLRARQLHVALSQIVAIEVTDGSDRATTAPSSRSRPQRPQTRIVLSAEAEALCPEAGRALIIPTERMTPQAALDVFRHAAATTQPTPSPLKR